jgi:hypothetical protein
LTGIVVRNVVHTGKLVDLVASDLPRTLDYPRKRAVKPSGLVLDLLKHVLGEVEALLAFVGTKVVNTQFAL